MSRNLSGTNEIWPTARRLLASALETDADVLPDDAAIGQLATWDSLAHMRLIIALEDHLGTQLSPESVVAIGSLADIATLLDKAQPTSPE